MSHVRNKVFPSTVGDHGYTKVGAGLGGGLWTPDDLAVGPLAWFDAQDADSLTLVSGKVDTWADKGSNGVNLRQTTDANRPTYDATGWDGTLPCLDNGTSLSQKRLSFTTGANTDNWRFVIMVAVWDAGGTTFPTFCGLCEGVGGSPSRTGILGQASSGSWNSGTKWTGTPSLNDGTATNVAFDTIKSKFILDCDQGGDVTVDGLVLMGREEANNRSWLGRFAEFVALNYSPTADERDRLQGYMAHRWDIASVLPGGHPYKTAAP